MKRLPVLLALMGGFVVLMAALGRWPVGSSAPTAPPASPEASGSTAPTTTPVGKMSVTTTTAAPEPGIVTASFGPESVEVSTWLPPLLAVSTTEAWVGMATSGGMADVIGHVVDDTWTLYRITPAGARVLALATTPEGTTWAVTDAGVFTFESGIWIRRFESPAGGVCVDAEGSAWIGGRLVAAPPTLWLARLEGDHWTRLDGDPPAVPGSFGAASIACSASGTAWIAHRAGYWIEDDLMIYDGSAMERVAVGGIEDTTPNNGVPAIPTGEVATGPDGVIWTLGYRAASPGETVIARFDRGEWSVYDAVPPTVGGTPSLARLAVSGDGRVWIASESGLHVFDGTAWETIAVGPVYAVDAAPDGAIWYADVTGVHVVGA